ncbi:MAG: hypothetical protein IPL51_06310 [Candidatus Competibacteraceae bacterium]|nr:hypothetical protein [Candidatus Competibacteraceae bacterium]
MKLLAEASARGHSNTAFDLSSRLRIDRDYRGGQRWCDKHSDDRIAVRSSGHPLNKKALATAFNHLEPVNSAHPVSS